MLLYVLSEAWPQPLPQVTSMTAAAKADRPSSASQPAAAQLVQLGPRAQLPVQTLMAATALLSPDVQLKLIGGLSTSQESNVLHPPSLHFRNQGCSARFSSVVSLRGSEFLWIAICVHTINRTRTLVHTVSSIPQASTVKRHSPHGQSC